MIQNSLLGLYVLGLSIYAWKDWYVSLCGLILLMAVIEHPDMPTYMFGIRGLNPWNFLFCVTVLAWAASRAREGLVWDMPAPITFLLALYFGVVVLSFVRMMADRHGIEHLTTGFLINEHFFNTIKFVIPGLLLFDGCRSRNRFLMGIVSILGVYLVLALLVIRWMPIDSILESGYVLQKRALRVLDREIGYHRIDLSMMLAGASWAVFVSRTLLKQKILAFSALGVCVVIAYGQALTAGRLGYIAWIVIGNILCFLRWRKYLWLAPVAAVCIALTVPSVVERALEGFGGKQIDQQSVTSDRTVAWEYVIDKIQEAPAFGFGRLGMLRTGVNEDLAAAGFEWFSHPHNAYLELVLDAGLIGLLLILPFYAVILYHGFSLFRDSRSPVFIVIGGVSCSLILAQLIASLGAQSFYPRAGVVGMWCAIGLCIRVVLERTRVLSVVQNNYNTRAHVQGPHVKAKDLRRRGPQESWVKKSHEQTLTPPQVYQPETKDLRRRGPYTSHRQAMHRVQAFRTQTKDLRRRGRWVSLLKRPPKRELFGPSADRVDDMLWATPSRA